jgi:hypothetical protein
MNSDSQQSSRPVRLLVDRPLPPYSYVSGKFPHPTRDTAGHSYGTAEPPISISQADQWQDCEPYLRGIDLFNSGYYWEAHENWEAVWHAAGRKGTIAELCKGLIKLAAAGVKAREGRANGVRQHAQRARHLFESVMMQTSSEQPRYMGLSLPTLIQCAQRLAQDPSAIINTSNDPVVVVMPFALQVEA